MNPLGLLASYGDSDDESDEGMVKTPKKVLDKFNNPTSYPSYDHPGHQATVAAAGVHPAPIQHCPWSACYDENSGFTYYWNQHTNAVTWEAPPEYLLALKLAQQQLQAPSSTEVSAEEWQLYQQALAEKQKLQNKNLPKSSISKITKKVDKPVVAVNDKNAKMNKKRPPVSDVEDEKIELITSYHNSDSESNEENDKVSPPKPKLKKLQKPQNSQKKVKAKQNVVEYGPSLPPNQAYSIPIGPELPPELTSTQPKSPENKLEDKLKSDVMDTKITNEDENQDEDALLKKLKDKAKLLEKLGGELPSELQQIIEEETKSVNSSPKVENNLDIDDLLDEIEKKELPKIKVKEDKSSKVSGNNSPSGIQTPPLEELKALYPNGNFNETTPSLFPSAANIDEKVDSRPGTPPPPQIEKEKKENVYLMDTTDHVASTTRKKLRISNSVLQERKKVEVPTYTTKYSQFIEGFSTERTGLGFKKDESDLDSPKSTISYGNGLTFTKGETLNEEKKDDGLDDKFNLVEAKLKYLNQVQPCQLTPIQEMLIQIQVVIAAWRAGALTVDWAREWAERAHAVLAKHEAAAAPPGWLTIFQRSEGRYCYRRESDGFVQWEFPAISNTDMEICTTPPLPETDEKEEPEEPRSPWARSTPPPPGTENIAPSPPALTPPEPKKEIGDELMSFYNDIAELEKETSHRPADSTSPEPPPPPEINEKDIKVAKKKTKVKLSTSLSMKNKSVSSLVAKWQQVAEEIDSD